MDAFFRIRYENVFPELFETFLHSIFIRHQTALTCSLLKLHHSCPLEGHLSILFEQESKRPNCKREPSNSLDWHIVHFPPQICNNGQALCFRFLQSISSSAAFWCIPKGFLHVASSSQVVGFMSRCCSSQAASQHQPWLTYHGASRTSEGLRALGHQLGLFGVMGQRMPKTRTYHDDRDSLQLLRDTKMIIGGTVFSMTSFRISLGGNVFGFLDGCFEGSYTVTKIGHREKAGFPTCNGRTWTPSTWKGTLSCACGMSLVEAATVKVPAVAAVQRLNSSSCPRSQAWERANLAEAAESLSLSWSLAAFWYWYIVYILQIYIVHMHPAYYWNFRCHREDGPHAQQSFAAVANQATACWLNGRMARKFPWVCTPGLQVCDEDVGKPQFARSKTCAWACLAWGFSRWAVSRSIYGSWWGWLFCTMLPTTKPHMHDSIRSTGEAPCNRKSFWHAFLTTGFGALIRRCLAQF